MSLSVRLTLLCFWQAQKYSVYVPMLDPGSHGLPIGFVMKKSAGRLALLLVAIGGDSFCSSDAVATLRPTAGFCQSPLEDELTSVYGKTLCVEYVSIS